MSNLHKAIRSIHNEVVTINGDTEETIIAKDINGNEVDVNWSEVNSWIDPDEYKNKRESEYPTIVDQLDDIYHNGIDGWKETIKAVKDKYPKE
jgi:glucuronate isomerase